MARYGTTSQIRGHGAHIQLRPLPPHLAKIAREELHETPDRIQQDLIILRVWIRQQQHLRARTSNAFLIAFLRRCRYSLEETKRRIDNFFTFYTYFPEVLGKRCVNQRLLEINRVGVHYYPQNPHLYNHMALLIVRYGNYCPMKYHMSELLRFVSMAMEIMAMENDNAAIVGVSQIIDMSKMTIERIRQIDSNMFKKWWAWIDDCCPLRFREVYVINPPKEIQNWIAAIHSLHLTMNIPFITIKKLEDLYQHVPRECLPEEYGGTNGHIAECTAYMEDILRSYRAYFEEDSRYGTTEELRSAEVAQYEAEFGAEGTFRKLEVD